MSSGLFRVIDTDNLISDSQELERRLRKSQGWLSIASLAIGAIIGSGIVIVVDTA